MLKISSNGKMFYIPKIKACLHKRLSTPKGVIRSRKLSLATSEEIRAALGKQGVTDHERITFRKGGEKIQMDT